MIFDGDCDYIGPYLRYLADNMGLRDWFLYGPADSTPQDHGLPAQSIAACITEYGQKSAQIVFREDWQSQGEDQFRWTCVHELLHCHFRGIEQPLFDARDMIGLLAFTPIHSAFKCAMEYTIDGIAYEWSRHLPLPGDWLEQATAVGEV